MSTVSWYNGDRREREVIVMSLTPQQEAFCLEYIVDLNGTQAAIRAGYSEKTARQQASILLTYPNVKKRISELKGERSDKTKIDAEYVLSRLKQIDELDIIDIVKDDMSGFRPLSEWPKEWRTSISGLDMKRMIQAGEEAPIETIVEKIKWPDKVKNLEMIGRHVEVKAWEKEVEVKAVTNHIMPVPTASRVEEWEKIAQQQQDEALSHE